MSGSSHLPGGSPALPRPIPPLYQCRRVRFAASRQAVKPSGHFVPAASGARREKWSDGADMWPRADPRRPAPLSYGQPRRPEDVIASDSRSLRSLRSHDEGAGMASKQEI